MFKIITSSMLVAGAMFAFMPTQASAAYRCTINPAICQAVCGKTVCGEISAGDRDLRRMERAPTVQTISTGGVASAQPGRAGKARYTCWNPAICKAVCGSASC